MDLNNYNYMDVASFVVVMILMMYVLESRYGKLYYCFILQLYIKLIANCICFSPMISYVEIVHVSMSYGLIKEQNTNTGNWV